MRTLLLGMAFAAFAAGTASAEGCSFGMAKMSEGKPMTHVAQSQKVIIESPVKFDLAAYKDAWLEPYLKSA